MSNLEAIICPANAKDNLVKYDLTNFKKKMPCGREYPISDLPICRNYESCVFYCLNKKYINK